MTIDELSDVGIGVVYEQLMLNRLLLRVVREHGIKSALEAPIYGMAGLCGINSMALVDTGVEVTLADNDDAHLDEAKSAWALAGRSARFGLLDSSGRSPYRDLEFDLVYNFAALWHLVGDGPRLMIKEMARVSNGIVLVCMPNPMNPLFQLRKFTGKLPKNAGWSNLREVRSGLENSNFQIIEEGLIDIPPWPDTVIPVKDVLKGLGMKKGGSWRWSMLDYYSGKNPDVEEKAMRYSFIEDSLIPRQLKSLWAHHRYLIMRKR